MNEYPKKEKKKVQVVSRFQKVRNKRTNTYSNNLNTEQSEMKSIFQPLLTDLLHRFLPKVCQFSVNHSPRK